MQLLQPMKPAKLDMSKSSHQSRLDDWFTNPEYVAELKIDGCHYFNHAGRILSTQVSKRTGNLVDKTENFPHLVEAFMQANLGLAVLDGEVYYPDDHKSYGATKITGCTGPEAVRRQELQGWISYMVFDIIRDPSGNWLFNYPWHKRREMLEAIMTKLSKHCEYYELIPVRRNRKKQFYQQVLKDGKEGIVLKHVHGLYIPGKRPMGNWIKLKVSESDDVVIMGFDPPVKEYSGTDYDTWPYWDENGEPVSKNYYHGLIGSIAFGKYDKDGELVYMGACTGITDEMRKEFTQNQDQYIGKVMEIKFMEKTVDGRYRHPNFVRIHNDKNSWECTLDSSLQAVRGV